MLSDQALRQGNLAEALAEVESAIRQDPANVKYRVFLFQLCAVLGQWDRALNQLNVVGEMDAGALLMAQMYRTAIQCEALRREVFAGRRSPLFFGEPQPWMALLLESVRRSAEGHATAAAELRSQAFEEAAPSSGVIKTPALAEEGQEFQWIADADARLGPLLEVIMNGAYYWVPFHCVLSIHVEEPSDLRDVVWMPVHITWVNQGETAALVPTRYSGSEEQADSALQLARKTEWVADDGGVSVGIGQRLLATDVDDYPLLDIRHIALHNQEPPAI